MNSNVATDVHINSDIDLTTPELDTELSISPTSHDVSSFFKDSVQDQPKTTRTGRAVRFKMQPDYLYY